MLRTCEICGSENPKHWKRCEDHYRCDDCETQDNLCTYREGVLCDPCYQNRVEKRIAEFTGECDYTCEIICPHCGYESGDSWEATEGEQQCNDCDRKFEMTRNTEVTYSTSKSS